MGDDAVTRNRPPLDAGGNRKTNGAVGGIGWGYPAPRQLETTIHEPQSPNLGVASLP